MILLESYCNLLIMLRNVLLVGLYCGLVVDPMSSWLLLLCYENFLENFIFGYVELVERVSLSCVGIMRMVAIVFAWFMSKKNYLVLFWIWDVTTWYQS